MTLATTLTNHLLVATGQLSNTEYHKSVVYVCEHHIHGTVGLIINRPLQYPLGIVFDQLHITPNREEQNHLPLLFGGPLQPERGFVIHKPYGEWKSSLILRDDVTITTSSDIIRALAKDDGPKNSLVTLGYVGWGENQLEEEVIKNAWLICPFNSELLYEVPFDKRWEYAGLSIGVHMDQLISGEGHA